MEVIIKQNNRQKKFFLWYIPVIKMYITLQTFKNIFITQTFSMDFARRLHLNKFKATFSFLFVR